MDRVNSHTKSYNIPHSLKAMYINIKYELKPSAPVAPIIYFNDGRNGGWGGGGPRDFFGSKILAKSDFFWVMKKNRDFFGFQKRTKGFFWGMLKKSSDFFG